MIKNVCIFASSSNYLDEIYYNDAKELGFLLAKEKFNLIYGGSKFGLMWACAGEVKKNNGIIKGIMPEKLYNICSNEEDCNDFVVTPCMRTRKAKMDEISDAVIALPGGFGTLDEVAEIIVQKQLGYNKKAIIFLNTNGFYNSLFLFFDKIFSEDFANKKFKDLYFIADNPQDVIGYLKNYKPSNKNISKIDIYER